MDEPIFTRYDRPDGEIFVATPRARGPWDPQACHGGAPAALLAALIDATPGHVPMQCVRLTYEIERPVLVDVPLSSDIEVARDGKRVQVLDATLRTAADTAQVPAGTTLVRCRGARVRAGDVMTPTVATDQVAAPSPGPDALPLRQGLEGGWATDEGFWTSVDVRFAQGRLDEVGPAVAWLRLTRPLAEGVATTPLARAAATADFGNGVGSPLPIDRFVYINPDLTVSLHRQPLGEWVAIAAVSVAQPTGIGLTSSTLFDQQGRIGSASQSLYIDARPDAG